MICLVRLESDKTICQVASLQHYAVNIFFSSAIT